MFYLTNNMKDGNKRGSKINEVETISIIKEEKIVSASQITKIDNHLRINSWNKENSKIKS